MKLANGEVLKLARIIYKHGKIINARIGDILFNKENREQDSQLKLKVCSLVKVIQETIFLLQEESLIKRLDLIYSGPKSTLEAIVKTDPQKLQ